ncbi:MAG: transaldolase [Gammaproteobacteria bacterium]|nr:transaldolase [Gammaproteobacteria bacterium]MDH5802849.1 transaldolase [Gammaproteobacteria bacterium]
MMNKLEQLSLVTKVVADTGDIDSIKQYTPIDATTNPSLLYSACQMPQYQSLVNNAIEYSSAITGSPRERTDLILDKIAVNFGAEILKTVPGRVSTEVDARLSFDTAATVRRAENLIAMYKEAGVSRERVLIKIASTWEGIQAAEILERQGIHCNCTLMFHMAQAVACAEAGVTLISPFVGRILDWYKKNHEVHEYAAEFDPGVVSVTAIYNYFKKFDHHTLVMGASFRNSDEILELAGCDLLTISPKLMEELKNTDGKVDIKLNAGQSKTMDIQRVKVDEANFRWLMNSDAMATEKLAEGIRGFTADTIKLEKLIIDQLSQAA